jgi:hypothetical protein
VGYQGRARRWAEDVLGVGVVIVRKPRKPLPEEVAKVWAEEWAKEGGEEVGLCVGVSRQSLYEVG